MSLSSSTSSEQATAATCGICHVDEAVLECSGNDAHGFCRECLQGYTRANMEPLTGEYERERDQGGLVSRPGELPCPHFIQGTCNCTAMAPSILRRFVDDDTFDMWRKADVRLGMAELERDEQATNEQAAEAKEARTPLDNLRDAVQEALTRGRTVCCPQCFSKGEKDDQCMHIKCASCRTEWCYCCGRRRGGGTGCCSRENGCDSTSSYLESQPGWSGFAIGEETEGEGAVNELHRKRIAYFLRQLKENTDLVLWGELQTLYPAILTNVPTDGRRIRWDEIDSAEITTFGNTTPDDVQWAVEGRDIVADLEERLEDTELQSSRHTLLQRRFAQYVATGVSSIWWKWVAIDLLALIALLAASIIAEEEILKISLVSVLCFYITIHLVLLAGFVIDWRYTILSNEEDDYVLPYSEVQFCGSRDERPYLSSTGRWSLMKVFYFLILFSCITFGVFLTLFFGRWSEYRCIENYGVCGLGPALLVFAGMVFGGGTLLVNLSPPPITPGGRRAGYRSNRRILLFLGGVVMPVGTYLMAGYADADTIQNGWLIGSLLVGLSAVLILSGLSKRFFSVRGFTLNRRGLISCNWHLAYWSLTVIGLFVLGTTSTAQNRTVISFTVCPTLLVLIRKIRSSP